MGGSGDGKAESTAGNVGGKVKIISKVTIGLDAATGTPIFACTVGKKEAMILLVGALQAMVMQEDTEQSPIVKPAPGMIIK